MKSSMKYVFDRDFSLARIFGAEFYALEFRDCNPCKSFKSTHIFHLCKLARIFETLHSAKLFQSTPIHFTVKFENYEILD